MPQFVLLLRDKQRGTLSRDLLLAHVAYLGRYTREGYIILCGPFRDAQGAIQVIAADSPEDARRIAESAPFIAEGYYASYEFHELIEANEGNNWLVDDPQTRANIPGA